MFRRVVPLLVCVSLVASAADLKYSKKVKDASGEHGAMTFYFQGQRIRIDHRTEFAYGWKDGHPETIAFGPRTATIYQCDMHRVLQLDFDHHQYTVTEIDRNGMPLNPPDAPGDPPKPHASGAKVKVILEARDTGETKQIFGQTARRFITTRRQEPSPGACAVAQETTEDGWYIDIDRLQQSCVKGSLEFGPAVTMPANPDCADEFEVERTGPTPPPFPVEVTSQSNGTGPQKSQSMTVVVTDFSRLPLDPQIFDLPMGYRHVDKLDNSPTNLPWMLRARLIWQSVKTTVWGWTPWGK